MLAEADYLQVFGQALLKGLKIMDGHIVCALYDFSGDTHDG